MSRISGEQDRGHDGQRWAAADTWYREKVKYKFFSGNPFSSHQERLLEGSNLYLSSDVRVQLPDQQMIEVTRVKT